MPRPPTYRERYANMLAGQGTMQSYEPSFGEQLGLGIRQLGGEQKLQDFNKLGGFIPGVGEAMDVDEVKRAAEAGNYGDAAWTAALAALPGAAVKAKRKIKAGTKKALAVADQLLGKYSTTTPGRVVNEIGKGGYSVHVPSGEIPETGLFVGSYPNEDPRNTVIPGGTPLTRQDVTDFAERNRDKLSQGLENYLGGWKEGATGNVYLDVSKRFPEDQVRQATKMGERRQQKKIFRKSDFKELPVGDWRKFITGKTYENRIKRAYDVGAKYMEGKTDWWELPQFEEIYGPGNMQKLKGFLAATSSNTAPRPNVQTATEYMRRQIAGEPIVQPKFRIPKTAMGGVAGPGKKLGIEASRANNLTAAALEQPLSGDVVAEKMQAMAGDPNALVLDRVHVRPTENPRTGVYATGRAGYGPKEGPLREEWRNVLRGMAASVGVTPARFGERVWAGLRELKGGALGPSFGYNDLFVDLIAKKAGHLGISIEQMKQMLREGKGELLVKALGIPIGAAAVGGALTGEQEQPQTF